MTTAGSTEVAPISVAFWGICDIKYDPRLPQKRDRVRVLELGDGRSSRFSHHGRAIKERFDSHYCMDEVPIKRAVMTENKKFTHDMFVVEGFDYLRPRTKAYPRQYTPDLAQQILTDLRASDDKVVLKLCNRSRGAGIVVVTANELDSVLKELLVPPSAGGFEAWLKKRADQALHPKWDRVLEEQCLHWWSNECPLFVVERCCYSIPVEKEVGSNTKFDGTMRVAFALYRAKTTNKYHLEHRIQPFEIDWLGAYWKMPPTAVPEEGAGGPDNSLEALHNRIVSSFNSVEKRTAAVSPEHQQEVFDALTPALPRIFSSGNISVQMLSSLYAETALFKAFAQARVAAAMRAQDMAKAQGLFDLARREVRPKPNPLDQERKLPELAVMSYIERNAGVCFAMLGKWKQAEELWRKSLEYWPSNSTAHYSLGCYFLEQGKAMLVEAAASFTKAIALDPDFKSPYVSLGNVFMLKGEWERARQAADACLQRHTDAPVALFIVGQSIYHALQNCPDSLKAEPDATDRAVKAFDTAKRRVPEQWTDADENMLRYLLADGATRKTMAPEAVHVWKVYGWRP